MTECLDQLRDNRSAINSPGIMDNSSVIAQGESGTRERERVVFASRVVCSGEDFTHLDLNCTSIQLYNDSRIGYGSLLFVANYWRSIK